mmetsp:Transcript_149411/g.212438  ORF Transcript_149411/g.212438 Transcript_149411/m.212438 type:complete len:337 (-) Transcript_149411:88-1098(-)
MASVEDGKRAGYTTTTTRLMLPDDANPAGNVHGGTILQLIEQSGYIAAQRHCQGGGSVKEDTGCALASVAECTFERPIHIGDVARCDAVVTYATSASLEVSVIVYREDLKSGKSQRSNRARLWYVQVGPPPKDAGTKAPFVAAGPVPAVTGLSEEEEAAGAARYAAERKQPKVDQDDCDSGDWAPEERRLAQLMLPSDASLHKIVFGGTLMKLMDNAAGIAAYTHCKSNVVTVSIGDLNLVSPVTVGSVVTILSRITFTSSRSLEIQVLVRALDIHGERAVASGIFNFVSLDKTDRPCPIPQLEITTEAQTARAAAGKKRYEAAKERRRAATKSAQ